MEWSTFFAEYGPALFWLAIAIAATIVESLTCDLVSIWFVPGALISMVLSFFVDWAWLQITVFLALSAVALVLTKTVFKKYLPQSKTEKLNADALIGEHGRVQETVDNLCETGSVRIKGVVWTARSTDDAVRIEEGSLVTVCKITGVKLICEPYEMPEEK